MKKVLIASTVISFIEWFEQQNIKLLQEEFGCEVHVACNCSYMADTSVERTKEFIAKAESSGVMFHDIHFARSPFDFGNIKAYREVKKLIDTEEFNMIHCHTPLASILVRLAARKARTHGTKVVCTSHGFHFFQGSSRLNWLIFYPIEKLCSCFTDVLITINKEDYNLACKRLKALQTEYIPGVGIDISKIQSLPDYRQEKRRELGIADGDLLVLGVGELNANKNHEVILRALASLKRSDVHFALAGKGPLDEYLKNLADSLGIGSQFHLLGFRRDVPYLYQAADIMVFPSFREGLPLSVMEGMAAGLPFVASRIRGVSDLLQDGQGAFLCRPDSVDGFADGLKDLLDSQERRKSFGGFNREYVRNFSLDTVMDATQSVYLNMLGASVEK